MSVIFRWSLIALFCATERSDERPANLSAGVADLMRGLRVLIVEDSYLTARRLARMIEDFGGQVVGPAPSVQAAQHLLDTEGCDAAVLDINLGNETVEPIAERLKESRRPFLFVTGYSSPGFMNEKFRSQPLLNKPVEPPVLAEAIRGLIGPAR